MSDGSRGLDNPINWSFGAGRVFGIRIRIHLLFIIGAVVILAQQFGEDAPGSFGQRLLFGGGQLALLFLIVLLHEFGHCYGAHRVGGQASEILMWPLGGLASVSVPHNARANLVTAVAGPMVNVVICLIAAGALVVLTGSGWAVPWNPFAFAQTGAPITSYLQYWLVVLFALSYMLLLFNLAPVFPLDGGRVLQCLLWPSKGFADATRLATGIGMIGAIGFGILGLVSGAMLLLGIAVFGYLTCLQQRQMIKMGAFEEENEFGYDFSKGYASLDEERAPQRKPGALARWRAARQQRRAERQRQQLEEHQRRVDAILEKISKHGGEALTAEERRILAKETERQKTGSDS